RDLATFEDQSASGEGSVEVVEDRESGGPNEVDASANSTNSAYTHCLSPVWPADSVLEKFMVFARDYSESEDCILIGSILPVVARLLGRRVFMRFSGRKFTNLYS